jgi:hypothetical protein
MQCVISGSYRKFYYNIVDAILSFERHGISVVSPPCSHIINDGDEFVIFASDDCADAGVLMDKHLAAIRDSDFLYVYNPCGYIGVNTSLEIGYAHAHHVPIVALSMTNNPGLDCFITYVLLPEDLGLFFNNRGEAHAIKLLSASTT